MEKQKKKRGDQKKQQNNRTQICQRMQKIEIKNNRANQQNKATKQNCSNVKRISYHSITTKRTLQHKKNQIAESERQKTEEVAPRKTCKLQDV